MFPFSSARISTRELAGFCRRVGTSLTAGLDLLRTIRREVERSAMSPQSRLCWGNIQRALLDGESLGEAMRHEKKRLGTIFVALIDVADRSGHLGETFLEIADDYEQILSIRRELRNALTWPVFQLVVALGIVGVVILVMGFLQETAGAKFDLLGFGLAGVSGLIVYITLLVTLFMGSAALYALAKQSAASNAAMQYLLARIPKVGLFLRLLAEARLARSLYLTMRTGMDVNEAITLAFDATDFAPVRDRQSMVLHTLAEGGSLGDAFRTTGLHSLLIENIIVGEEAGELPEMLDRTATFLMREAISILKQLAVIGYFLIYALIAAVIIFFIFRIASFYIDILNNAAGLN